MSNANIRPECLTAARNWTPPTGDEIKAVLSGAKTIDAPKIAAMRAATRPAPTAIEIVLHSQAENKTTKTNTPMMANATNENIDRLPI
jgi:hypothetical protein